MGHKYSDNEGIYTDRPEVLYRTYQRAWSLGAIADGSCPVVIEASNVYHHDFYTDRTPKPAADSFFCLSLREAKQFLLDLTKAVNEAERLQSEACLSVIEKASRLLADADL